MLVPVVHILPLTTIKRDRTLPVPGRVTARAHQKVNPLDVVAEANYGGEHLLIDVACQLDLQASAAQGLIQVKAGDLLTPGALIARGGSSLFPKTIRAPREGRVLLTGGGQVLIEPGEALFQLKAGIPGTILRLIPERGAEIMFNGALVQGVWGNGQLNAGMMLPLLISPGDTVAVQQLDVSLRGSILLAGHCSDPAVLQAAGDLPVRGLILASMSPTLVPLAKQVQYPIILVDGFGPMPMNGAAFKLLTTNAKREVTLNAAPYDRQTGNRPEILVPLPVTQAPPLPNEAATFTTEQPVRLKRNPHAGEIGILIELHPGLTILPSGLRVAAADVRLDSGELVLVPLANLEVLG